MVDDSAAEQGFPVAQTIYANVAGASGGPFDLAVLFGYTAGSPDDEEGRASPQWLLRVAMSWEHARALQRLLSEQIDKYEGQVGPIPDIEKLRRGNE